MSSKIKSDYNQDFYAWALHNAQLLREGRLAEVDIEHVAEEIESMGRSDKRELTSRCAVLLAHLLKWQAQPERRCNSWKYTIEEQREEVAELLDDSPSLKHELAENLARAYKKAVLLTATEAGISKENFPKHCPFTLGNVLADDFFPGSTTSL